MYNYILSDIVYKIVRTVNFVYEIRFYSSVRNAFSDIVTVHKCLLYGYELENRAQATYFIFILLISHGIYCMGVEFSGNKFVV